jgi:hypothetical protein
MGDQLRRVQTTAVSLPIAGGRSRRVGCERRTSNRRTPDRSTRFRFPMGNHQSPSPKRRVEAPVQLARRRRRQRTAGSNGGSNAASRGGTPDLATPIRSRPSPNREWMMYGSGARWNKINDLGGWLRPRRWLSGPGRGPSRTPTTTGAVRAQVASVNCGSMEARWKRRGAGSAPHRPPRRREIARASVETGA